MQEQHAVIAEISMQLALQQIFRCDALLKQRLESGTVHTLLEIFQRFCISGVFSVKGVVARWTSTFRWRGVTVSPSRGVVVQRDPADNEEQVLSKCQHLRSICGFMDTFGVWDCV